MVAPSDRVLLRQTLEVRAEQAERELESSPAAGTRRRLREIREALERLTAGTFGFCEGCFLTIPWRELVAEPERRRCARCAPSLEGAVR